MDWRAVADAIKSGFSSTYKHEVELTPAMLDPDVRPLWELEVKRD